MKTFKKYLAWKHRVETNTPAKHWIGINLVAIGAFAYYFWIVRKASNDEFNK